MKCGGYAGPHGEFRWNGCGRSVIHAMDLGLRESCCAPPCQAFFQEAASSGLPALIAFGIEDRRGSVFSTDVDRSCGIVALVEKVTGGIRGVVGHTFPEGHPRWFDWLECLDVEARGGGRWYVADALRKATEPE